MRLLIPSAVLLLAASLTGQAPVQRPKILGIAHLAVFVSDLTAARGFYRDFLGFEETVTVKKADREDVVVMTINGRQTIELINRPNKGEGQLDHVALQTDDVARMREYLASKGVRAASDIEGGPSGEKRFFVTDPDGHTVEIVELPRDATAVMRRGGDRPSPISDRALHVGILVGELARSVPFYAGVLGFEETWRGSAAKSPTLSWVNMRVPEGTDYLEFMLYGEKPAPDRRGTAHHLCLMVPDAAKAVAALDASPARQAYARSIEIRTGINRKRQVNLFDPDGTRVELMEPETIDGVPAPPSPLPPPR